MCRLREQTGDERGRNSCLLLERRRRGWNDAAFRGTFGLDLQIAVGIRFLHLNRLAEALVTVASRPRRARRRRVPA